MLEPEFEIQEMRGKYAIVEISLRDAPTSFSSRTTLGTVKEFFDTLKKAEDRLRELQAR